MFECLNLYKNIVQYLSSGLIGDRGYLAKCFKGDVAEGVTVARL